ncbi:MAG: endonuclease III [Flavobacteriales bacterium]|nr:endonuclease III [Flavobacteriales bacterium]
MFSNHVDKIDFIIKTLENLYPEPEIPLDHKNTFTFLVAVMLSAQSTDKKVNEITPPLFAKADSAKKMSMLKVEEIKNLIRQIGLAPTKSKNIKKMSQILVRKYNGKVPNSLEKLKELPGVGQKTASVIVSQIFNEPAFPVDTHIHRLAYRWKLSSGKNVVQTEKDLKRIFPVDLWNKLHLQIIFFGREYCKSKKTKCSCVICSKIV